MNPFELMTANGTIKEFRTESAWAYRRRIRRQMRYVDDPLDTFWAIVCAVFWVLLAGATIALIASIPFNFVRWWMA